MHFLTNGKLVVFLLLLVFALECRANEFAEKNLDEKVAHSDLVVIGTINELISCGSRIVGECSARAITATVAVSNVLKGSAPSELLFRCSEPFAEASPSACHPGTKYLLFLRIDGNGIFHSVNGSHGAYELTSPTEN
ncbi:hypothetical protein [Stenotrophomonas sp. ATCM1_4]|uniref:hypothetical protein n=1 Tax=Stenotrophomonas sp. ATCM1_4 TaxID=2259330 RepID=UPI001050BC8B|nr:hypothetical protein [Stenotrophomonas sp. ATCM1_4]